MSPAAKKKPPRRSAPRPAAAQTPAQRLSQADEVEHARLLRGIFDTAVEGIITISSRGEVLTFNRAAEKLFGWSAAEAIGQNVKMLMGAPHRENHDGYLEHYLQTGEARIIGIGREVEGLRKDGTTFPMALAVCETRMGAECYFTGFVQDLTERRAHERAMKTWNEELESRVRQRTEELIRANQELEHFAYAISHDLRTPLRGIRNYVDFLREDLEGKVEGETAEDLARLGRATDELDRMIEELLEYSRVGRTNLEPEAIDIGALVKDIAGALGRGPDRQIKPAGKMPALWGPYGMIRQVFQNLVENGIHYNKSAVKRVEVSARSAAERGRWIFSFKDNGIGIDPRYHDKIFGMFERLHATKDFSGTGIGLAVVRKAVLCLGGSISVESAPGEGSVFHVELPERMDISVKPDLPAPAPPSAAGA